MKDEEDDSEITLTIINLVHVFKIPPRRTAKGHYAADWENCEIWSGRCKVIGKGQICEVILEDTDSGDVFATCRVSTDENGPTAIEKVVDSSRYFVLRIENQGSHAFIGIGFGERSEAFDFNVALQDHKKYLKRAQSTFVEDKDTDKYKWKDEAQIKVNFKVKKNSRSKKSKTKKNRSSGVQGGKPSGGGLLMPPPKSSKHHKKHANSTSSMKSSQQQQQQQQQQKKSSDTQDDFFSDFSDFVSSGESTTDSGNNNQNSSDSNWTTF